MTTILAVHIAALLFFAAQPASACGSTDYPCQATYMCYGTTMTGWGAVNYCVTGGSPVCTAWRYATGDSYNINCSTMGSRGGEDDVLAGIFKAGQQVQDGNGKLIEIDQASGEMLQVASSISALQRRGAAVGSDVNASFKEAGIPVVDSVDVEVADDTDTGGKIFTLRGKSDKELVMRFDAEGNQVQETPEFEVGDDVQAAMAEAAESSMSPRGGWCAQARPTTGGCAVAASPWASSIPGATGTSQFLKNSYGFPASADVFSSAAYAGATAFAAPNWSVPNAYNALSLVEFANLGFVRTQTQFDEMLAFCWIPRPDVPGSGICTNNPSGVCPYDANAGVICQSMSGM